IHHSTRDCPYGNPCCCGNANDCGGKEQGVVPFLGNDAVLGAVERVVDALRVIEAIPQLAERIVEFSAGLVCGRDALHRIVVHRQFPFSPCCGICAEALNRTSPSVCRSPSTRSMASSGTGTPRLMSATPAKTA